MKILAIHNAYQQPGGEDTVFEQERRLLEDAGHEVIKYYKTNVEIARYGMAKKAACLPNSVWSSQTYREVRQLIQRHRPDIAHIHNTFFVISPSVYGACRTEGLPVVQTLHNYRLFCPAATFFREGRVCEECVEHNLLRSVRHGCYRESRVQSAVMVLILASHRAKGTWINDVDYYIVLTEFSRNKFLEAGLPSEKLLVKPNFAHPDPGSREGKGEHALFLGRLSGEKGPSTVLRAWQHLQHLGSEIPLSIVGDGPLRNSLERYAAEKNLAVKFLGQLSRADTLEILKKARFLVFASEWYESFAMTLVEAFACGVPIVCSRLGIMEEVVAENRTGVFFTPGDAIDLAAKVQWAWEHSGEMQRMGLQARQEYESKYTGPHNYRRLMEIYERAIRLSTTSARQKAKLWL